MSKLFEGFSKEKKDQINKSMEEKHQGHTDLLRTIMKDGGVLLHADASEDENKYYDPSNFYHVDFDTKTITRERDDFKFEYSYIVLERSLAKTTFRLRVMFSRPVCESKPGLELLCYKNDALARFSPTKDAVIDEKLKMLEKPNTEA